MIESARANMQEFEYKFSRNDPVLVVNTVKTITEKIRGFHSSGNKAEYDRFYKYLREKCFSNDVKISSTAIDAIVSLCEGGDKGGPVYTTDTLLDDFMPMLQLHNTSSVIYLVFYAMDRMDFTKYGIMINQHPLITVLKRDGNTWPLILTQINQMVDSNPNVQLLARIKPFVLYTLYDYDGKLHGMFQHELLKLYQESADSCFLHKILLFKEPHLLRSVRYCRQVLKTNLAPLPSLILCIRELLRHNLDPSEGLLVLKQVTVDLKGNDVSVELCLLVGCIELAPLLYLNRILEICDTMLSTCTYKERALTLLKSALLKWKLNMSTYNAQTMIAKQHIDKTISRKFTGEAVIHREDKLILDLNTFIVSEILKDSLVDNLKRLDECPGELLEHFFDYLLSVLCENDDEATLGSVLPVLLRCSDSKSSSLLAVVLYKLANCLNPNVNLSLIRALPKLAALKENLPIILTTVKTFSVYSPRMQTLAMHVLYEIFCVDIRCFNYLQELLVKENKKNFQENEIVKAYVLKELCRKGVHLEVYGSELTGYISRILNSDRDESNCIVQTLALEGLKHLCSNDIIDVGSAWCNLGPHYENDSRSDVVRSLCEMLSEISNETSTGPKSDQLLEDVVNKLWNYTTHADLVIVKAAFEALGHFNLEQISAGLPPQYLIGSCNVFGNIPGGSWVNLLMKCKNEVLTYVGDLLKKLIMIEIKNFKSNVYTVSEGRGEPENMDYLPGHSILAPVFNHLKSNVTRWKASNADAYLECLGIISCKYSRPLPPANWCFLQELIHDPAARTHCIGIASHQVIVSGTARQLMENYILALSDEKELNIGIINIYEGFLHLSNSIQPMIVKPFVRRTLELAISEFQEGSSCNLDLMLDNINIVLADKSVSDVNKVVFADEIINKLHNLDINNKVFERLLNCVHTFPMKKVNDISSVEQYVMLNTAIVERSVKIRCTAAINAAANPFEYLNDFVDCPRVKIDLGKPAQSNISFHVLHSWLKLIFSKHQNDPMAVEWLIELMAKIQLELADRQDFQTVLFKSAVFIIAVCVLSGMDIFRSNVRSFNEYSSCFPYALCSILRSKTWTSYTSQVLEWLYDVSTNKSYKRPPESEHIVHIFKLSLLTLRNEDAFNAKLKWMKFVEIDL